MCNHRASSPLARGRAGAGGPSCLPPGAQPIQGHVLALESSTFSSSSPQSLFPGRRAQSLPGSPTAVRALWRASGSFLNLLFSFAGALWSWRGWGHCRAGPSRPPRAPGTLSLLCRIPGVPRGVPCPAWWDVPPWTTSCIQGLLYKTPLWFFPPFPARPHSPGSLFLCSPGGSDRLCLVRARGLYEGKMNK